MVGHENAALYDASWMEWGADPERPVEVGARGRIHDAGQPSGAIDGTGSGITSRL